MRTLNILIVEDEALYADLLADLLEELGHRNLGVINNADEAEAVIREQVPDLVLMDIQIAGGRDGIELADAVQEIRPTPIIFITSQVDDYTYSRAKATQPYAFLEKTFRKRQLQRAIELVIDQLKDASSNVQKSKSSSESAALEVLMVKVGQHMQRVFIEELLYIKVEDHYCILQTAQHKYASRIALKELMVKLPQDQFFQTHRSFVINLKAITSISNTDQTIQLGAFEVPLGRSFKEKLMQRIQFI